MLGYCSNIVVMLRQNGFSGWLFVMWEMYPQKGKSNGFRSYIRVTFWQPPKEPYCGTCGEDIDV